MSLRCVRTGTYLGAGGPETALTAPAAVPGPAEMFLLKDWGGGECTLQFAVTYSFTTDGYYDDHPPTGGRLGGAGDLPPARKR